MALAKQITESGIIQTGQGKLKGLVVNSHTGGTLQFFDGTEGGVVATTDLTSTGASAPADYAVGTLSSTGVNVSDGNTVVVGATGGTLRTYRFKTVMLAAYDVQIGADAEESLANLKKAINATGTVGTEYFAGTLVNPNIIGYTIDATSLVVGFRTLGVAGNAYTTTETSGELSWGGATLAGGVATTAATFTLDTVTYMAVLQLAETLGLTAVPFQVFWITSEAVFLDNIKMAINASGIGGTQYSTGTTVHPTVVATVNSDTVQTFNAKNTGTAGNSIVTTETIGNYAFDGATMSGGTGATGKVLINTITLPATAALTTFDRQINFGDVDFATGLYITVGGTLDATVVYGLY